MLIVGAKGFAKEILQILYHNKELDNLVFYDDINIDHHDKVLNEFPILRSGKQVENYFKTTDNKFTIGIGNPFLRYKMYQKFVSMGGIYTSTISPFANIGSYEINIGNGCNILPGVKISNCVNIEMACIIYYNSIITHDVEIGKFVEISPSAILLGGSKIGDFTHIGSGATVLPYIQIGSGVVVAAGAVVTKEVPDNCMVAGIPAIIKNKHLRDSIL